MLMDDRKGQVEAMVYSWLQGMSVDRLNVESSL
jgi:hypothetical protein